MSLSWLEVHRFRNIEYARLIFTSGFNLISGLNGSGKTSLLEACYFLSSARSHRSTSLEPVLQKGCEDLLVRGLVNQRSRAFEVGISRQHSGERHIRVNGEKLQRSSDLARLLPALSLGPESVELLLGPPSERRKFLNWGLFHVEQSFGETWEAANRCLRQRNQVLRADNLDRGLLDTWNHSLGQVCLNLHQYRQAFFDECKPVYQTTIENLTGMQDVTIDYLPGWDTDKDLVGTYADSWRNDRKRGYTQKGFHRADVRINVGGQPATKVCSRGELKSLVWSLVLAQGQVVEDRIEQQTLYLIDDLASEFDSDHRRRVCRYLRKSSAQVVLTGIERKVLEDACDGEFGQLFHVEHGNVTQTTPRETSRDN